eukprot:s1035_g3.t1
MLLGIALAKQQRIDRRSLNSALPLVSSHEATMNELHSAFFDYAFHQILLKDVQFFHVKETPVELRHWAPKGTKEKRKATRGNFLMHKSPTGDSETWREEKTAEVTVEVKPKLSEEQLNAELPQLLAEAEQLQAERDDILNRLEEKEADIEWLLEMLDGEEEIPCDDGDANLSAAPATTMPGEANGFQRLTVVSGLKDGPLTALLSCGSETCCSPDSTATRRLSLAQRVHGGHLPPKVRGAMETRSTWMAGKMQLMHSTSVAGLTTSQFLHSKSSVLGMSRSDWSESQGPRLGKAKSWANLRKAQALDRMIAEVRNLAGDAPIKGDGQSDLPPKNSHEALLIRLKSRAARLEAEKHRDFIASYWQHMYADEDSSLSDAHLDSLLTGLQKKEDELRQRSEELQLEAKEAERRLEHVNSLHLGRASDLELQAMNAFERSQRRIQEDKKEEEYQKQRDEVQALFAKVHRRLQSELIELRDYKVLLREYRRVRLEKLSETLGRVQDGRRLRHCVRVMIRNGAQRILQRLESAKLPLEPWMREVLLNCCYVEIRIEDTELKLLGLRRQALKPVKEEVLKMMSKTKAERFEDLFVRTLEEKNQKLGLSSTVGSSCGSDKASLPGSPGRQTESCVGSLLDSLKEE